MEGSNTTAPLVELDQHCQVTFTEWVEADLSANGRATNEASNQQIKRARNI